MGERQYGAHSLLRTWRVSNYFWMMGYQALSMMRTPFSRFIGVGPAPLNYSGIYVWLFVTSCIMARFRLIRARDVFYFNRQDNPEFWYSRYNMMFPPNFLHNRISAHYIEINHIFAVEMIKKYQTARKEILAERDTHSDLEKRTMYATNANYIYEPLPKDDDRIQRMKDDGEF
jgi:hypothetical protein